MKTIHGQSVGTTLPFAYGAEPMQARHPWPAQSVISAGGSARRGSYFLEVYPPGMDTLVRGDGHTREQAEDQAWSRYQDQLHCPKNPDGVHVWVAGQYRNGVGVCVCGSSRSKVFTAADLNQFCHTCGVGTLNPRDEAGVILCLEHAVPEWESEMKDYSMSQRVQALTRAWGRSEAMQKAIGEVTEDWSIHSDEPAAAPTLAAQQAHYQILVDYPELGRGNAVPVPRIGGGIRIIVGDGRRIDIEDDGQAVVLAYSPLHQSWIRRSLEEGL